MQGSWVLSERIIVKGFSGAGAELSNGNLVGVVDGRICSSYDGGRTWKEVPGAKIPDQVGTVSAFGVLKSGRWLVAAVQRNSPTVNARATMMGERGGYQTIQFDGFYEDYSVMVFYSDAQGKNWHRGKPFKGALQSAMPTACRFIESPDGTVALPIAGSVTDEDMTANSRSTGVIRSHDGGQTWGDFSFIFRVQKGPGDLQPEGGTSEMDIVVLPCGDWVAVPRAPRATLGPRGRGISPIVISTDLGRTWKKTGACLAVCHQQTGVLLSGGGIAFTFRSSWEKPGVAISYDGGRNFDYMLSGPNQTNNALRHGKNEFVLFTEPAGRSDGSAGVYRWIPRTD